jgi:hypothetical protein
MLKVTQVAEKDVFALAQMGPLSAFIHFQAPVGECRPRSTRGGALVREFELDPLDLAGVLAAAVDVGIDRDLLDCSGVLAGELGNVEQLKKRMAPHRRRAHPKGSGHGARD